MWASSSFDAGIIIIIIIIIIITFIMMMTAILAETGAASSSQGSIEVEVEVEKVKAPNPVSVDPGGDVAHGEQISKRRRRRKRGGQKQWHRNKTGAKSRGKEDEERKAKVDERIEKIRRARENLENPYDEMDIDTKKSHALFLYNDKMADILTENEMAFSSKSVLVKKKVAKRVGVSKRTVGRWVLEYLCEEEVKKSKRGRHSKCDSPIDDAEFRASFCEHVRSHAKPKGTWVNRNIQFPFPPKIVFLPFWNTKKT